MKAIRITQPGPPEVLQVAEVPDPELGRGNVLIEVKATALNRADLLQRRGLYPPPPGVAPDILGLEFAGRVLESGPGVTQFQEGDRVMGLVPGGAYAQKLVVPAGAVIKIPSSLSWEEAASLPEAFITAYDALFGQLGLQMGESILIHAVGSGVGLAALQLAHCLQCRTFGTSRSAEKLERARDFGLQIGIHAGKEDFAEVVLQETQGQGVPAIMDFVGAAYWQKNLASLAYRGRLIVVGLLGGTPVELDLGTLLRRRWRIFGTALRGRPLAEKALLVRQLGERVLPLVERGLIRPVVDRVFDWQEAAQAHAYMEANRNFGKIVLRIEGT